MKQNFLILFLFISFLYSNGQKIESIGIKGGISFATMNDNYYAWNSHTERKGYKTGIYIVFTSDFFKGKNLGLSADLGFIRKGMRNETNSTLRSTEGNRPQGIWEANRDCISFSPVMKGFHSFRKLTSYAQIGPRLDFDISSFLKDHYSYRIHELVLGLNVGVGTEYKIGKFSFLSEFSWHPDLTAYIAETDIRGKAYIITSGLKYHLHYSKGLIGIGALMHEERIEKDLTQEEQTLLPLNFSL